MASRSPSTGRLLPCNVWRRSISNVSRLIPLTLMQTSHKPLNPTHVNAWLDQGADLITFFVDEWHGSSSPASKSSDFCSAEEYLHAAWGRRYVRAYRSLRIGAIRSDFLRLCYVADRGGFYSDRDVCPGTLALRALRHLGAPLVLPRTRSFLKAPAVWNAFFGAAPRHPLMISLCHTALERIEGHYAAWGGLDLVMGIAGPVLMAPLLQADHRLILHMDQLDSLNPNNLRVGGASAWVRGNDGQSPWLGSAVIQCPDTREDNYTTRWMEPNYWMNRANRGEVYWSNFEPQDVARFTDVTPIRVDD